MPYKTLSVSKKGSTLTVKLNRPAKFNSVNEEMLDELFHLFKDVQGDNSVKIIIFAGTGKIFSYGADIEALDHLAENSMIVRAAQRNGHDFMRILENLEQVTFAAINGPAIVAGLALAMACDFRIMSDNAYLSIPEAAVGLFFTWGCTPRLTALVGPSMAKELIMTCQAVDAEKALRIGLVNRIAPYDQVMNTVNEMAVQIGSKAPLAIRMAKKIVNASAAVGFGDLFLCEPELVERLYLSKDPIEGVQAFVDKREPRFTGE